MAKRGPKPKPTQLRLLQGNPGKRPINTAEPQPGALGAPPADLCDIGLAKWAELIRLECWGLVATQADADLLEQYCRIHAQLKKAEGKVAEFGELVKSPNGFPCQSPWLNIVNRCRADMFRIALEFGGSPASRTRLSTDRPNDGGGKFAGLLAS